MERMVDANKLDGQILSMEFPKSFQVTWPEVYNIFEIVKCRTNWHESFFSNIPSASYQDRLSIRFENWKYNNFESKVIQIELRQIEQENDRQHWSLRFWWEESRDNGTLYSIQARTLVPVKTWRKSRLLIEARESHRGEQQLSDD